jgi:hypothetical protein
MTAKEHSESRPLFQRRRHTTSHQGHSQSAHYNFGLKNYASILSYYWAERSSYFRSRLY